jgi:hypothetical protein
MSASFSMKIVRVFSIRAPVPELIGSLLSKKAVELLSPDMMVMGSESGIGQRQEGDDNKGKGK